MSSKVRDNDESGISEESARKEILELEKEELEVDETLKAILQKRNQSKWEMESLKEAVRKVSKIDENATCVSELLTKTAALADNVSAKVRHLDLARSRVAECQQRVHDLLDLQVCSAGVEEAILKQDYEKGAAHVQRFLSMSAGSVKAATGTAPVTLKKAAQHLRESIASKFKEATKKGDEAYAGKLFKLFPMVGMTNEGIALYADFLGGQLTETARQIITAQSHSQIANQTHFADLYTNLLETCAEVFEQLRITINTVCGKGFFIVGIKVLQTYVDKAVKSLGLELFKARNLEPTPIDPKRNSSKSLPNALELDPLLSELTVILSRISLYVGFLRRRVEKDTEKDKMTTSMLADYDSFISQSEMNMFAKDVLGHYLSLERYHLDESISKAMKMAAPVEGQHYSSLIDDVFYITKKCISRSLKTGSAEGACAIILEGTRALETVATYLARTLSAPPPLYPLAHPDRSLYLAHVSDACVGAEYVSRLRAHLRGAVINLQARAAPAHAKSLDSCLDSLAAMSNYFQSVQEIGIKQLHLALKPRVHTWVDEFSQYSYVLTEEEWAAYGGEDEFAEGLIKALETHVTPLTVNLAPSVYETLKNTLFIDLALRWEKQIFNTKFNRLGGLCVERGIRRIAAWAGLRTTFKRLLAITSVLAAHTVQDATFVSGLTQQDIHALLTSRLDFKAEDIKKARL